jgi:hypothetical protein
LFYVTDDTYDVWGLLPDATPTKGTTTVSSGVAGSVSLHFANGT